MGAALVTAAVDDIVQRLSIRFQLLADMPADADKEGLYLLIAVTLETVCR